MNWFRKQRKIEKGDRFKVAYYPSPNSPFNYFLLLLRAAKVCALALAAVSGSLWLAWAGGSQTGGSEVLYEV